MYCILKENVSGFSTYLDVSEDLSDRIRNRANEIHGFSQGASLLKTKELTQTRIQRALLHIILGIHTVPEQVPYARVLGFRKESSPLLKEIKKRSRIPLLTKLADAPHILDKAALQLLRLLLLLTCTKNSFVSDQAESSAMNTRNNIVIL